MSIGVIIARLQPVHNGHLALIEKSMNENEETYLFIGSADKFNNRNPVPISIRLELTTKATEYMKEKYADKHLHIVPLDDLTDESDNSHDWGFYLYSTVVSHAQKSNFTIYYSDGFEIITTWFPAFILRNNISMNLIARNSSVSGISATQVREYIMNAEDDKLRTVVPEAVYELRDVIRNYIKISKDIHN